MLTYTLRWDDGRCLPFERDESESSRKDETLPETKETTLISVISLDFRFHLNAQWGRMVSRCSKGVPDIRKCEMVDVLDKARKFEK